MSEPAHAMESVGHHFVIGLQRGTALGEHDRAILRELRPAGVVLYKSNFDHEAPYSEWLPRHAKLLDDVRDVIGRERLLIAIDHEGGKVCRTPPPITRFAAPARWAGKTEAVGQAVGAELASLGINLNFAPLLDINSNPQNPVIGDRAFATTAEAVSAAALPFIAAMQAQGVLACGKHFPGHGDASHDSHHELPVVNSTLDELRARELKPFADAARADIPLIMTSHILFTAIDPSHTATVSRRFITDVLREELGFAGAVISDDLGMHAMDGVFDKTSAAVRCVGAGNDLLLIAAHWTNTDRARGFAEALLDAKRSGELSAEVLERSRERIEALLQRAPQNAVRELPQEVFARHRQAAELFRAQTVEVI